MTETAHPCPLCGHSPCLAQQSTVESAERCVLPHRKDPCRPRRTLPGLHVCPGHRAGVSRQLAQLGPLDRVLTARAAAAAGPSSGSKSAETRIPLHALAVETRQKIRGFLSTWAGIVAEERGFTPPDLRSIPQVTIARHEQTMKGLRLRAGTLSTVDALTGWLRPSEEWLCAHPAVDDFAAELAELHGAAFRVAYPDPPRRLRVSPCPFLIWSDVPSRTTYRCVGWLIVTFRRGEDVLPDAECDTCGWTLDPRHWLGLADKHRTLTAVELSAVWDVPLKTVERWARDEDWPHDDGRPRRYLASSAQHTHDRLRLQATG